MPPEHEVAGSNPAGRTHLRFATLSKHKLRFCITPGSNLSCVTECSVILLGVLIYAMLRLASRYRNKYDAC